MINIRPVSDLRNKYPEIEELVLKENEAVYLTKNGYGSMVVMSLEKYAKLHIKSSGNSSPTYSYPQILQRHIVWLSSIFPTSCGLGLILFW